MMNLASFIVAFFLICLIIAVPPFGILVLIFYVIWWIFDSGKNDQCQTTEVTIITEIPSNSVTTMFDVTDIVEAMCGRTPYVISV